MKLTPILLAGLCVLLSTAHAQETYLPGYIVRHSGDTLRGFLREEGRDESARHIVFKPGSTDTSAETYTPAEVKSYQYDGGNLFRAVSFSDVRESPAVTRTCYGRLLVSGAYDLYSFTEKEILFFLVKKDTSVYLLYDDDLRTIPYVSGNFKSELNFFAADCEAIRPGIGNMDYTEQSLMKFIQDLDRCVNPGQAVTSYFHKAKGHVGFFAYAGGMALGNETSQYTLEARLRLVYPQLNPSMSFNLGVRYVNYVHRIVDPSYLVAKIYHEETYQMKSIPVTLQYNLTRGIVQPFLYGGLSALNVNIITDLQLTGDDPYYHNLAVAGVVGGGVEVHLSHVLFVRAEERFEYIWQWPTIGLSLTF